MVLLQTGFPRQQMNPNIGRTCLGFEAADSKLTDTKIATIKLENDIPDDDRQTLDHIITKLSKEKKPHNGVGKKTRILLVSETNNACLSLSSSDDENEESGEPDLHQCGHCRQMFYNFTKYITHKLQKTCWNAEATPTDDVTTWPLENNGMSSPGEKGTDVEMEGNIEVKNLHQDLQKRKHRKGMVRRIKPPEENLPDTTTEPIVYVPADEETVYVQAEEESNPIAEQDDQEPKDQEIKEHGNDTERHSRPTVSAPKYGVSLYNYSRSKAKPSGSRDTEHGEVPKNLGASNTDTSRSPQGLASPHGYPHRGYSQKYYQERGFYAEQGAHGVRYSSFSGNYEPYSKYRKTKYYDEPPVSFYPSIPPSHRNKTSYNTDKYKSDSYLPYDQYRTMASLPAAEQRNTKQTAHSTAKKDQTDAGKNTAKEVTGPEKENASGDSSKNFTVESDVSMENLPQLVHSSQSNQGGEQQQIQQEEGENTSAFDKSPPALEKCESSITGGDQLKIEEESRDSINGGAPEESPKPNDEAPDASEAAHSPSAAFKYVMSPDKESNSPQGSTNSHETEDYSQDSANREPPEIRLPRHRQLSESTVERLITEPVSQSDASWKHAKQVYRCPLCAKIFPFKSKLQRHVLVHTGIKPYKCTVCGRGFTQQIDLQRHLTRHTGEKPFKCHLCKAQFIRADNLRKHCKDAHYVSIEEPIRKRRRKTTGSDTVLPPLEVAIALALSETERNGGRVLGRATTRTNTRTTTSGNKPRYPAAAENTMPHPPRPNEVHPSMYSPRMSSRAEATPYPSNYPPQLGPRQSIRYPFHHGPEGAPGYPRRPRSPSEFHPNSPPYIRGSEGRYVHSNEPPGRYYQQPPPRGYYMRPGYERESDVFFQEKDEGRSGPHGASKSHTFKAQDYRSMALDQQHPVGYPPKRHVDHPGRPRPDDPEYIQEMRKREEEYGERLPDKSPYRMSTAKKHSPGEYIKPREREGSPSFRGGEDRDQMRNPYSMAPPRADDDHRALFRGKPSISYGDYGTSSTRTSESTTVSHDYRTESAYNRTASTGGGSDPGEFVTMATAEKDSNLIEPRLDSPGGGGLDESSSNLDTAGSTANVFVDEQETPIVTPSDDHMLTTSSS